MKFLPRENFQNLLNVLRREGYHCIGPQVKNGAIVYDTINKVTELPIGIHDKQAPGQYRLESSDDSRYFAWANGPQAIKPLTFAPRETLWRVKRNREGEIRFLETLPEEQAIAVIGVRSCDMVAMLLQDQHFCYQKYPDVYYSLRRRGLFLIAVDCSHPADTCFCHSTGDGPSVNVGFDMALTELDEGFLVRVRSVNGRALLAGLPLKEVTKEQRTLAKRQHQTAIEAQKRRLPSLYKEASFAKLEHPRWEEIAQRCLSCSNCTSVCPTCFCHSEAENPSLDGRTSEHYREWDSCFTVGHSYMHNFVPRDSTMLRYRQWFIHKLCLWHKQYGRSGCVGCGRCITWCPVGIDITEEAAIICGEKNHAQS
jgi:sulfhydrogenase subunit beta (sulfur reductase)